MTPKLMQLLLLLLPIYTASFINEDGDKGLSGRFRNLSARPVHLYWVSHDGTSRFTSSVHALGGEASFQTYTGHSFFFSEIGSMPPRPIQDKGSAGSELFITEDRRIYAFTDLSTPKELVSKLEEELTFMERYYKEHGRHWFASYPKAPPLFPMWPCDFIGQIHTVELSEQAKPLSCDKEECRKRGPVSMNVECIAQKPRLFLIEEFLSPFESSHFITAATPFMRNSSLDESSPTINSGLVGTTAFHSTHRFGREGLIGEALYRRTAEVMGMPEELFYQDRNVESMNVLRYEKGQHYTPHFDGGSDGGPECRFTSMLIYFSQPKRGGETSFPRGYKADGTESFTIKAKKRSAIFFYNLLEDGNLDQHALHSGEV
jgi:hypothetical protein